MKKKKMYKLQQKMKKTKKGTRQRIFDIGYEKMIDTDTGYARLSEICEI